jgi:peptide chain release factor 1
MAARRSHRRAEADMARLHGELQTALLPRDPDDERNAFIEIRAGTGRRRVGAVRR